MSSELISEPREFPEILYGTIFVCPFRVYVCEYDGRAGYNVGNPPEDLGGLKVCFLGWIYNDESENWTDHYYRKLSRDLKSCTKIMERYPVELFYGKREGDQVSIPFGAQTLILTCKQAEQRYAHMGQFQEVLHKMSSIYGVHEGKFIASSYRTVYPSSHLQRQMITDAHIAYSNSIGYPINDTEIKIQEELIAKELEADRVELENKMAVREFFHNAAELMDSASGVEKVDFNPIS